VECDPGGIVFGKLPEELTGVGETSAWGPPSAPIRRCPDAQGNRNQRGRGISRHTEYRRIRGGFSRFALGTRSPSTTGASWSSTAIRARPKRSPTEAPTSRDRNGKPQKKILLFPLSCGWGYFIHAVCIKSRAPKPAFSGAPEGLAASNPPLWPSNPLPKSPLSPPTPVVETACALS
jgi:hypothetical protein